jgi:hypothetical protein
MQLFYLLLFSFYHQALTEVARPFVFVILQASSAFLFFPALSF